MRLVVAGVAGVVAAGCQQAVQPGIAPPAPTPIEIADPSVGAARSGQDPHDHGEARDDGRGPVYLDPGAETPRPLAEAIAVLYPTQESSAVGVVRFREVDGELHVIAAVDGLPQGEHAYHVHVYGDCSAPDATSAGPHFHYTGSSLDESVRFITGNLGELHATDPSTTTTHHATVPGATLHGRYSIIGRSVVVHERGNNPAITPDGGAGKRLACGVIGVATPPEPEQVTRR